MHYLDDLLVFADSIDELNERMTKVAGKCRDNKLSLNASKAEIGMKKIEYVGHVCENGSHSFHPSKLQKVFDFKKPKTVVEMQSFLGLCNVFRDSIEDYYAIERPFRTMIAAASSSGALAWNKQLEIIFEQTKRKIVQIPKLFYYDDKSPIFVETDASDYGIGACIYQIIKGEKRYIQFVSKTLDKIQFKWSTPEKEAYAIWSRSDIY